MTVCVIRIRLLLGELNDHWYQVWPVLSLLVLPSNTCSDCLWF